MDAALLDRFRPVLYLDGGERIAPVSFEAYVDGSSLVDEEHGTETPPGAWSLADHADNPHVAMQYERAPASPSDSIDAPAYTVCTVARDGGRVFYSLLYVFLWPVAEPLTGAATSAVDRRCSVGHLRVLVDKSTSKVAKVYFSGADEGTGGWLRPDQASYADSDRRVVEVFVGRGTHSLWPRPGRVWRIGGKGLHDRADGLGVVWRPNPAPMPGFLGAWKGSLARGVPTPGQSSWFSWEDKRSGDEMLTRIVPAAD